MVAARTDLSARQHQEVSARRTESVITVSAPLACLAVSSQDPAARKARTRLAMSPSLWSSEIRFSVLT